MKPIYQPDVQALMDSINNQILSVQKELYDDYFLKLTQRTGHLKKALTELYRKNTPTGYELTELEKIQLQEINNEQ